jgi:hypothetical protein
MSRKLVPLLAVAALCAAWFVSAPPRERLSAQPAGPKPQKKLPKLLTTKPLDITGEKDEMRRLVRQRYNAALEEVRGRYQRLDQSFARADELFDSFRRLLASGVAATDTGRELVDFLVEYADLARDAERRTQAFVRAGQANGVAASQARYMVLDAEIQLLRARRRLAGPAGVNID